MGKNQDPGSGINIPDPQHCLLVLDLLLVFDGVAGGTVEEAHHHLLFSSSIVHPNPRGRICNF
jgi:hypothetical protein